MVFTFQAPGSVVSVTSMLTKKSPRNVSLHGLESLKADGQATHVGVIKMCDCRWEKGRRCGRCGLLEVDVGHVQSKFSTVLRKRWHLELMAAFVAFIATPVQFCALGVGTSSVYELWNDSEITTVAFWPVKSAPNLTLSHSRHTKVQSNTCPGNKKSSEISFLVQKIGQYLPKLKANNMLYMF